MKDYGSVTYEGQTYKTVVIGTQTWFQRNLNYAVAGSKCDGDDGKFKDENTNYCDTYGRLYNWATAMALPDSCNSKICSGQINAKHKGICPAGWHVPSDADWNVLMKYINPSCSDNSNSICAGVGTELKANSSLWADNAGTDNYGFSALPGGGCGYYDGGFGQVGISGYWWSASECYYYYYTGARNHGALVTGCSYGNGGLLFSVRCVQD